MSVRVGESWTARNGHRRWISMPLPFALAGFGAWAVFVLPFLALWWLVLTGLWLTAEVWILTITGVLALAAVARREGRPSDVTLSPLRWGLFMIDLKARQP